MMKKLIHIYLILAALLPLFSGCSDTSEDAAGKSIPIVYLSVTRATGGLDEDGTINTDGTYYEDRVHDLSMLVFDSSTGEKVAEYDEADIAMTGSNTFVVKLTPGQRDFYFIANVPDMKTALQSITNEKDLQTTYMNKVRDLDPDLYQGAALDKGFPMSRVYLNQTVSEGGSIYQPVPFRPTYVDKGTTHTDDKVKLIRVTAKLEVSFSLDDSEGNLGVKKVTLHNANAQYCLTNPSTTPATSYSDGIVLTKESSENTYYCYMPESVISSASWQTGGNNQPINYFTIETTAGQTYDIPIITDDTDINTDYLKKATGQFSGYTPDYTIYRNHDYRYTINNLQTIEILYSVDDWNTVNKSLYMGYGYNVEVDETSVTIKNTFQACPPFDVQLKTVGSTTFSDGTTEKDFTEMADGATASFDLNAEPESGAYLEVYYNNKVVKTFSK
jgi:hypothetical protein